MIYTKYDYSYDSLERRMNAKRAKQRLWFDLREKIPFTLAIVEAEKSKLEIESSKPELSDIPF